LATLGITIAGPRLLEWTPNVVIGVVVVLFYGICPLALLGWNAWRHRWLVALNVVLATAILFAGVNRVAVAGSYLNFLAHKPVYDRVVQEAKGGTLSGRSDEHGFFRGRRSGVKFTFLAEALPAVMFPWSDKHGSFLGVVYDEADCPRPPPKPPIPGLKQAGSIGLSLRLSGHYCLLISAVA
jgi:hypothetical protein